MASLSHYRAMTTNPGAVPQNAEPSEELVSRLKKDGKPVPKCRRTGIFKPPRAHYDSQLQRNVVRMDHHCPWVNNCIGIGNQKLFLLFLFYISLSCWYSMFLLCSVWWKCTSMRIRSHDPNFSPEDVPPVCQIASSASGIIFYALLCIEALMFGLFTACMLCDQVASIIHNQTKIDRLQGKEFNKKYGFFGNLREVMGDGDRLVEWLCPLKPYWKDWQSVYGYCVPRRVHATPLQRPISEEEEIDLEGGGDSTGSSVEMVDLRRWCLFHTYICMTSQSATLSRIWKTCLNLNHHREN